MRIFVSTPSVVALIFASCFSYASQQSAAIELDFKNYTIQKDGSGLSNNSTFDVVQDKHGFVWIATEDGLNRFDGEQYVFYRHNPNNPKSIPDNFIRRLYIDSANTLWIGTEKGLVRYNKQTDDFSTYTQQNSKLRDNIVWEIFESESNQLLVATRSGLNTFDTQTRQATAINLSRENQSLTEIKSIFQDTKDRFWIGTYENGLFLADKQLTYAVSLAKPNRWDINVAASSVFEIKSIDDNIWVATDKGLYVFDDNYRPTSNSITQQMNGLEIRALNAISERFVLIGSVNGLYLYDSITQRLDLQREAIENQFITKIVKGQFDKYWITSWGGGLFLFNNFSSTQLQPPFTFVKSSNSVTGVAVVKDKLFWITPDGNQLYSNVNKPINLDSYPFELLTHNNELYVVTWNNALYKVDLKNNRAFEVLEFIPNFEAEVLGRAFINENKLWYVGEDGSLNIIDLVNQSHNSFNLKNKDISQIVLNSNEKNKILVASNDGHIFQFDFISETFSVLVSAKELKFNLSRQVSMLFSNGNLWLANDGQGVLSYDIENKRKLLFDENKGLANNVVTNLAKDDYDNIWVATSKGLSVINSNTNKLQHYSFDFLDTNTTFSEHASAKFANGNLVFGEFSGVHIINPKVSLAIENKVSKPILSNLSIANKPLPIISNQTDEQYPLDKALLFKNELVLKHKESPFTFSFISPNSKIQGQVAYRYFLEGFDENWITAAPKQRSATYTGIPHGSYRFKLEAYDTRNSNLKQTTQLDITILPPWFLTTVAKPVYTLLAILFMCYVVYQVYKKREYTLKIKQSEERLKLSLWGSGDEMWDWNLKSGRIYRSNIWGVLDFPQDGRRSAGPEDTNIHPHDIPRVRQALNEHFAQITDHFESTYRVKSTRGDWVWVLDRGKVVERDHKQQPIRMTGTLKDISVLKNTEESLKLFEKCVENISDAVVIYDQHFNIIEVNEAYELITGETQQQILGRPLAFSLYPDSFVERLKADLIRNGNWHDEIEAKRPDGETYLIELNLDVIRDESQAISHFVGVFSDITERKKTESELRKLANSDSLTQLPNRAFFQATQTKLVEQGTPHALLVFDLDNFKKINDSMGHEIGDMLLCSVADRISNIGRKQDTVYRLGGDEFSLIIENTNDIHTITSIAKEVLETIAQPMKLRSQEVVLYSSIGIVLYPEDGASSQELLKNADTAMYHAKNLGGNRYQFFSDNMNKQAVKRLQVENLIRHGLKEDYFSVFYQPKINIETGKVSGIEALVRFETPSKGLISPLVFIPVSEETGQIIDIGAVVLKKACYATKKWLDAGLFDGKVAVNLSAIQFTQPNLVESIANILQESGLPANHLELEITEGTVMENPQKAIETMLQLRHMGIHLSLDDFGTGYSSLAYLRKFPLNTLKIDKAFVDDIEHSEQGRNMVATIVTIAHNLGLEVVAEGVESNGQLKYLSELKCEQLQGYLYSKPISENDFHKYLLSHQITNISTSFK
ncbi:EAL domain-containing protein [Thalassotalea agarivorans]|uniref:PAS domain S-box-containing protein/diguanylate cyclase (GGDEF) domain-containing protein n=1 Tax=Thalassotalea agarivorans TaxID=349064 RepID=A0A1I0BNK2_THASX|nr:EAL domain-containing protein [Thalassotalea agarivorans]SET08596.1 PAS domain S-box-containing protein/diguanylate cyclase (GGDEF) domain-containing protein [Thalassotalea agarivorans]